MIAISKHVAQATTDQCHEAFLKLVPTVSGHANFSFRHLQLQDREEAIAEVLCYAYVAFRRLAERGRLDLASASALARFGVARVRSGRYAARRLRTRDVYARQAGHRGGFRLVSLQSHFQSGNIWAEILTDDRVTPVPDQVAFRLDFASWLSGLKRRDRKLVKFLAIGNTPSIAAKRFGVSRARVSQLRDALRTSWEAFQS